MWSVRMAGAGRFIWRCVLVQHKMLRRAAANLGPAGHPTALCLGLLCPSLEQCWGHQLCLLLHAGSLLIETVLSACSMALLETLPHMPAGD